MPRPRPDYRHDQVLYLTPALKTAPAEAYSQAKVKFAYWSSDDRATVRIVSRIKAERRYITTHMANLTRRKPRPAPKPSTFAEPRPLRRPIQPLSAPAGTVAPALAPYDWWHSDEY